MAAPTYVDTTQRIGINATTAVGDRPSSLQNGDKLVAWLNSRGLVINAFTPPSGWVPVHTFQNSVGGGTNQIWEKDITNAGSEPSTYTWTLNGADSFSTWVQIVQIRGAATNAGTVGAHDTSTQQTNASDSTVETPSINTSGSDRLVMSFGGQTTNDTAFSMPSGPTTIFNNGWATGPRGFFGFYFTQSSAGATPSTYTATMNTGTSGSVGVTVAYGAPDTRVRYSPDSVAAQSPASPAVTLADIQENPATDTTDTDGFVPADPSGSSASHPQQFASTQALWTGGAAHTWTNVNNALDTSDTTFASYALGANTTDYMDHWSFPASAFNGIPSNATITGIQVLMRARASSTNRLTAWIQLAAANNSLIGTEYQVDGGAALPTTVGDFGGNATWSTLPTRAQLVTGTFGIRTRLRRSNTVTAEMYSIKVTVTYTTPGSTTNTTLRVTFPTPSTTPETGAGLQEFRARVAPRGTKDAGVSTNPQARITLYESGVSKAVSSTLVDVTSSQVINLQWNASSLSTASGANVEAYIEGNGVSGQTVSIYSVDWMSTPASVQVIQEQGSFAVAGVSDATLSGLRKRVGIVAATGQASVTPNAKYIAKPSASVNGVGAVSPSARRNAVGSFAAAGVAGGTLQGRRRAAGVATIAGLANVTKSATKRNFGAFAGAGVSGGTLQGRRVARPSLTITGVGTDSFNARKLANAILAINGVGAETFTPLAIKKSGLTTGGVSNVLVSMAGIVQAAVAMAGTANVSASALRRRGSPVSVSGAGSSTFIPLKKLQGIFGGGGTSSVTIVPLRKRTGALTIPGLGSVSLVSARVSRASATAGGISGVAFAPRRLRNGGLLITGSAAVGPGSKAIYKGQWQSDGGAQVYITTVGGGTKLADFSSAGIATVALVPGVRKGVAFTTTGVASVAPIPLRRRQTGAQSTGLAGGVASGRRIRSSDVLMPGTSNVLPMAGVWKNGNFLSTGSSNIFVTPTRIIEVETVIDGTSGASFVVYTVWPISPDGPSEATVIVADTEAAVLLSQGLNEVNVIYE